jgi:osomolarity two-component system response regulator SSK1
MMERRWSRGLPYHVIWMDLQMPVLDGINATRRIRDLEGKQAAMWETSSTSSSSSSSSSLPRYCQHRNFIVAITANIHADDEANSYAAGADHFIQKPASLQRIATIMAEQVRHLVGFQPGNETQDAQIEDVSHVDDCNKARNA